MVSVIVSSFYRADVCWPCVWKEVQSVKQRQRLTGIFTNIFSISAMDKNMVRGVIKCCSRKREREGKQNEARPVHSESGKVILWEAIIILLASIITLLASIIALKLQRVAVSKNKEDSLGHHNKLIFRVCNLMISSQMRSHLYIWNEQGVHTANSTNHFISKPSTEMLCWEIQQGLFADVNQHEREKVSGCEGGGPLAEGGKQTRQRGFSWTFVLFLQFVLSGAGISRCPLLI